jgi:hypothetical protein
VSLKVSGGALSERLMEGASRPAFRFLPDGSRERRESILQKYPASEMSWGTSHSLWQYTPQRLKSERLYSLPA